MTMSYERAAGERAEAMALQALAFIAADEERFQRFLATTGTTPDDVRARAADTDFLSGVFDHMLADEALLLAFAENAELDPATVAAARYRLPGAAIDAD
jgi:hypothetical protein